ncbi:SAV_6107 family HEPN domain-containing protein [Knoellia sp. 3-2P3]|uniref:SAV_6107 family HEPN domain-containing protein n=1 Tax=unclassified Knoellia TaxID=2618719 RepID=UPI0023DAD30B|nr:SAV_6107 family HEPN domain-containing protein [Knoellia sp. 3-2P3]MDF2092348.1 SAV_6107 family HEPN domain-containing protein [Knoellia sp. 3-2P3]
MSLSARSPSPATPPPRATAATTLELVERARADLLQACHTRDVTERYRQSRLGAMRAAAALVSARARGSRPGGPQSLWELVPAAAPELTEWAEFFAVATARPERLERPARLAVSAREADDLLRQAETFIGLVCRNLGLPVSPVHHDVLVPTAWA